VTSVAVMTGSPTPRVTWRRVDAPLVESADGVHSDSFGQELVFTNVDFADQGIYECTAVNTERGQPKMTHKTQLIVECKPGTAACSSYYDEHLSLSTQFIHLLILTIPYVICLYTE